jgi:hypothetical protein
MTYIRRENTACEYITKAQHVLISQFSIASYQKFIENLSLSSESIFHILCEKIMNELNEGGCDNPLWDHSSCSILTEGNISSILW